MMVKLVELFEGAQVGYVCTHGHQLLLNNKMKQLRIPTTQGGPLETKILRPLEVHRATLIYRKFLTGLLLRKFV